ncbi:hypothetical protein GQ457_03G013680 [Hibiscus cannabinus]
MNAHLVWTMLQSWSFAYRCFSFNGNDMTSTIEEYTTLLNIHDVEVDKIYTNPTRPKGSSAKIMMITRTDKDWVEN